MRLGRPFKDDVRIAALATMGVAQFSDEGYPLKYHRDHPEWDLPLSPYYVNHRLIPEGPLTTEQARLFGQDLGWVFYLAKVFTDEFKGPFQVVGVPNTGKPLAEGFASIWSQDNTPRLLEMRKEGEGEGMIVRELLGGSDPSLPIVMVDDVITKGGSKLETLAILEDLGYKVPYCVVVVDREQGGREELAEHGVELVAATTFSKVLAGCREMGLITQTMFARSAAYPATLEAAIAAQQRS